MRNAQAAAATSPTQVQLLARYAARASFDDLAPASRTQLPIHILDSLGCCVAALGAGPVQACREQVRKSTARPTMRWLFPCFEGIDLHHTLLPDGARWTEVLRLTALHRLVLRLLGPGYEIRHLVFHETAE